MTEAMNGPIAIIEDDALVLRSLGDCMESAGYSVEGFGSAEAFLGSSFARNAACLIVDVQLPGITGLELQGRLAGGDHHPPIVFVTAHGTTANREQAMKLGAAGFLSKPVRREQLLNAVRAVLQH